jgi:hypothetical protein
VGFSGGYGSMHPFCFNDTKKDCMRLNLVFVVVLFLSCSTEPDFIELTENIQIDLDESVKGNFSDRFESIDYLLLDFSDSMPLV